jgi:hypothetical protein
VFTRSGALRNAKASRAAPLEKYRPKHFRPRREFVYCRPDTDFSRCGIINAKYIYRVDPEGFQPQVHDLAWISDMQMAALKAKYPEKLNFGRDTGHPVLSVHQLFEFMALPRGIEPLFQP